MDFKDIYQTLSKLDLSKHLEKKMGLTYLSWANAWDVMMTHYPTAQFSIEEPVRFDDGSMEVWTKVMIEGHERVMWLPVMDHRNQAIKNPSSRQVSDARMRCLVKNLAMFGLGLYVYQGEDLPRQEIRQEIKQEESKRELKPSMKKAWENCKVAFKRDGNMNKVKERFTLTKDIEMKLVEECHEMA